jgi:hypothetical protein
MREQRYFASLVRAKKASTWLVRHLGRESGFRGRWAEQDTREVGPAPESENVRRDSGRRLKSEGSLASSHGLFLVVVQKRFFREPASTCVCPSCAMFRG